MITWADLGLAILAIAAFLAACFGALQILAAGNSSNPEESNRVFKSGGTCIIVAAIIFAAALKGLFG